MKQIIEDLIYLKVEINKFLISINDEMEEAAKDFYKTRKDKEKDDALIISHHL